MKIAYEFTFGDDKILADELKELVLSGKKTATTGLYILDKKIPKPGEYAAILDSNGERFCIIKYTNVEVKPFLEVNFSYIQKEGNTVVFSHHSQNSMIICLLCVKNLSS
jgi:uncharacterized protein YhfF